MESLQVSIESGLYEISDENLEGLAAFLDIEGIERLTRLQIIRKVRREIENQVQTLEEQDKSEENTMKYLQDIKTFIEYTSPTLEPEEIEATETVQDSLTEAKVEFDIMQREFQRMLALQEEKLREAKEKMEQLNKDCLPSKPFKTKPQEFRGKPLLVDSGNVGNIIRFRDLKSQGVTSNDRNRISYLSLNKQIESAISKGYSENEIVDAVINAISPCLHLKSYLESIKKLSLEQLRQTLRSQYCEKTASEIYQELTNVVQELFEILLSFLMRALKLCQQIIIASEENNSKIKYEESSINSVSLHTVETGLADENIRTRLHPFLLETDVSDKVLIREINFAMTSEHERQGKLAPCKLILKTNSPASVSAVTAVEEKPTMDGKSQQDKAKQDTLTASIEALRSDFVQLKQSFNPGDAEPQQCQARPPSACESCKKANTAEKCDHCFVCGSDEHFARGWKKRSTRSENRGQLRRRDNV
eukprot:gene21210-23294_t